MAISRACAVMTPVRCHYNEFESQILQNTDYDEVSVSPKQNEDTNQKIVTVLRLNRQQATEQKFIDFMRTELLRL